MSTMKTSAAQTLLCKAIKTYFMRGAVCINVVSREDSLALPCDAYRFYQFCAFCAGSADQCEPPIPNIYQAKVICSDINDPSITNNSDIVREQLDSLQNTTHIYTFWQGWSPADKRALGLLFSNSKSAVVS